MSEIPNPSDPHDIVPSNCHDVLALAKEAMGRYWREPTVLNLYPMALLTSHAVDWYVLRDLGKPEGTQFVADVKVAYPQWDAIRRVGNGLKHPKVELVSVDTFHTEDMMWEHRDAWGGVAYGTKFGDRMMPIDRLCFEFVRDFSGDIMSGEIKRKRTPTAGTAFRTAEGGKTLHLWTSIRAAPSSIWRLSRRAAVAVGARTRSFGS